MDYNQLLEKCQALQQENNLLKEENKRLKLQLGISEQPGIPFEFFEPKSSSEVVIQDLSDIAGPSDINNYSRPTI